MPASRQRCPLLYTPRYKPAAAEFITSSKGLAEGSRIQLGQLQSGSALASGRSEVFSPAPSHAHVAGGLLAWISLTFVKEASSVFMKARNSLLESFKLSPSRPAYRWKTASRDSMQRSVSVGDTLD